MNKKKTMPPEKGSEPQFETEPGELAEHNPEHQLDKLLDRDPEPNPIESDPEKDPLKEWEKRNRK